MPDRHGPYRNTRFILEIDEVVKAGFSACRLPTSRVQVIEYREGNDPPQTRKLGGLTEVDSLVLEAGVTTDSIELFEWHKLARQGKIDEARRSAAIIILDEEGAAGPRWELDNAWLHRYEPPRLDARGKDVAIETIEIVAEAIERVE